MAIRKGKTKQILESAIESALLAVEIYNKPNISFKTKNYIVLMIIAWTKLFHAHFNHTIGDKYYYKEKNGRYKKINGERKSWELNTCINKYNDSLLSEATKENIKFFIGLRNKIEHSYISNSNLDVRVFGECQSLLYNFENFLVSLFGEEYSVNCSLAFALQFSIIRKNQQLISNRQMLSSEMKDIYRYIESYKSRLSQHVYDSMEYSIKIIQIPKISNTNRSDLSIEFVNWDRMSSEDRLKYNQVNALIKDKIVKQKVSNLNLYRPTQVIEKVNEKSGIKITMPLHTSLRRCFEIRPKQNSDDPFSTNDKYCIYDEAHEDYLYTDDWVELVINFLSSMNNDISLAKNKCKEGLNINDYESR